MKKLLTILAILATTFLAHSQAKTRYQRLGKLTTAEINAIDVSDTSVIYTAYDTILGKERINAGLGWVDRFSGTVSGTVDYADILNKPANIDEDSTNDVEKLATSPDPVLYWKGTKAQFYSEYGNPPTGLDEDGIYVITDSIPATPNGGGDMLRSIYDTNNNGVVDNAAALGGVPAASYLTSVNSSNITNGTIIAEDLNTSISSLLPVSGTFTFNLVDLGGGANYESGGSYSKLGRYTKIGNFVYFDIRITGITTTGTPSGTLAIRFLPFTTSTISAFGVDMSPIGQNFYSIRAIMEGTTIQFEIQQAFDDNLNTRLSSVSFSSGASLYLAGSFYAN